jgi:hypothetical protein
VRNIDGCGVPRAKHPFRDGRVAEHPYPFFQNLGHSRNGNLIAQRDTLKVQRNIHQQRERRHHEPQPLLRAVMVAAKRVEQVCRVGSHARNHVCADGGAHGGDLFVDEGRVVAVDDQDGHDPEDEDALEEVVVVEAVHEFAEVGPDVP